MGLYYQTEYRLGRRGGRVCRSYTGLRAFLAIAIDLLFVLTFELAFGVMVFVLKNFWTLLEGVHYALLLPFRAARRFARKHPSSWLCFDVVALPFRAAHWVSLKLYQRAAAARSRRGAGAFLKPAWAGSDEL